MRTPERDDVMTHHPLMAAAVGAAAGLVGAWVMVRMNHLIGPVEEHGGRVGSDDDPHDRHRRDASPNDTDGTFSDEPATMQAASAMSEAIAGRRLSEAEKRVGGSVVHYAFGAVTGAFYGVLCEARPEAAAGGGLPFGAAVWLVADEVGVPLAGFADNPLQYPVARHASALATHLAFGATVEAARRILLRLPTFFPPRPAPGA